MVPADGAAAPAPASVAARTPDRRGQILEAFEHCIVRSGFHRTTMQDVAREAGMSAGNLYRYFASKEALVEGLAERDRDHHGREFVAVQGESDVIGTILGMGRHYMVETPTDRCVQMLEIWAEGARNPAIGAVCRAKLVDVTGKLNELFEAAKAAGQIDATVDVPTLVDTLMMICDGLFIRRAIDPQFDAEAGFMRIRAIVDAVARGSLDLSGAALAPRASGVSAPQPSNA